MKLRSTLEVSFAGGFALPSGFNRRKGAGLLIPTKAAS